MKRCPSCQRGYADETLSFCLQDGALLLGDTEGPATVSDPGATIPASSQSHRNSVPTEVLPLGNSETIPRTQPTMAQEPRVTAPEFYGGASSAPPPTVHNTKLVVGLTVIATLILIALGGVGAWFIFKSDKPANSNRTETNQSQNGQSTGPNNNLNGSSSPQANTSPSTGASPAITPVDTSAVREQVTAVLNGWTSASRAHDLEGHMSHYADTLDTYYNASNVSASRVRADRARAYALYTTLDIELSNVKVTSDPSGNTASAVFDKTWTFEGSEKYSSGSVHQKIWLTKIGGRWLITGEKDLQVYYVNRAR
jgi:ketosteroid isomerase-like protein